MHLLNLTLGQFLAVFGSVSAVMLALYLLDRSRRKQVVSTLRFWVAAEQPTVVARRRRIQQPCSLLLQLASMALLLLAIAQLRLGAPASAPRDHVLILDTSAWMAARTSTRTLMDLARDRARAYVRAVPARDRIMLVRADALTTPATAFEPDRKKLEEAIAAFAARRHGAQPGPGAGLRAPDPGAERTAAPAKWSSSAPASSAEREPGTLGPAQSALPERARRGRKLRPAPHRRAPFRQPTPTYGRSTFRCATTARRRARVTLALTFGPSLDGPGNLPAGSQRLTLAPGADREASFQFRSRAARLSAGATSAARRLPRRRSRHAATARPARAARDRLFRRARPAAPRAGRQPAGRGRLSRALGIQRARPRVARHPGPLPSARAARRPIPSGSIRRAGGSPVPVRARVSDAPLTQWLADHPLGAGLRAKDLRLESASVFEAAPDDLKIAEVAEGPVIVARPGKPKIVVLGFHPALSAMRYELSTPLLFANLLRWMAPEIFRRWELTAGSVGTVKVRAGCRMCAPAACACCARTAIPCRSRCAANRSNSSAARRHRARAGRRSRICLLADAAAALGIQVGCARRNAPRHSELRRAAAVRPPTCGNGWRWRAARDCWPSGFCYGRFRRRVARVSRRPAAMRKAS